MSWLIRDILFNFWQATLRQVISSKTLVAILTLNYNFRVRLTYFYLIVSVDFWEVTQYPLTADEMRSILFGLYASVLNLHEIQHPFIHFFSHQNLWIPSFYWKEQYLPNRTQNENNYPISIIPIFGKIYKLRIYQFLEKSNLLCPK